MHVWFDICVHSMIISNIDLLGEHRMFNLLLLLNKQDLLRRLSA